MISVGIDVSKGKSMIAAVDHIKREVCPPTEFAHTKNGIEKMSAMLMNLSKSTSPNIRIIIESTGQYHEPILQCSIKLGFFISVINPILTNEYGNNSIRKVKTDKEDALKIARYGIDNWHHLHEYLPRDTIRHQLKTLSRQYNLNIKTIRQYENNLIAILDNTMPGANKLFASRKRKDGRQKWIDFVQHYHHADNITMLDLTAFIVDYEQWCFENRYKYNTAHAIKVYNALKLQTTTQENNAFSKLLVTTSTMQITTLSMNQAVVKEEMIRLSTLLPEYGVVSSLYGVGDVTGAQLIAEIGDITRFKSKKSLVSYAGIDPLPQQSGKMNKISTKTSKRGSPHLRKTLYQIVCTHLRHSPAHDKVYQYLDRKRTEGKPFYVYMTATSAKFLHIYYAKVMEAFGA